MQHLDTLAIVTTLATATGNAHMAFITPVGADLSEFSGVLPAESLDTASRTGLAIVAFSGFVSAALAYDQVERRMSLAPGGTVILVQDDGKVRSRHQPLGNLVAVDFTPEASVALPRAA